MVFAIIPESYSDLSRIPVRIHPGIAFAIRRIPQTVEAFDPFLTRQPLASACL